MSLHHSHWWPNSNASELCLYFEIRSKLINVKWSPGRPWSIVAGVLLRRWVGTGTQMKDHVTIKRAKAIYVGHWERPQEKPARPHLDLELPASTVTKKQIPAVWGSQSRVLWWPLQTKPASVCVLCSLHSQNARRPQQHYLPSGPLSSAAIVSSLPSHMLLSASYTHLPALHTAPSLTSFKSFSSYHLLGQTQHYKSSSI